MAVSMGIAVLHFNKVRLTRRCLDSVMDSVDGAELDKDCIHCLDNGSTRETFETIVREYPDFHHHRLEDNRGYSGGFNAALAQVFDRGYQRCLFLTNDTIYHKNTLATLDRVMVAENAGLVAPCIRYISNPDTIDSLGACFCANTASLGHYHELNLPGELQSGRDYVPGTALAIDAETFHLLDGADEAYHTYWEDVDLSFRAGASGVKMLRCPEARIDHGVGQTCHKKPFYTTFLFQRNRLKFCRQHLSDALLAEAEKAIQADWESMRALRAEKNDTRRLKYFDDLYSYLA